MSVPRQSERQFERAVVEYAELLRPALPDRQRERLEAKRKEAA